MNRLLKFIHRYVDYSNKIRDFRDLYLSSSSGKIILKHLRACVRSTGMARVFFLILPSFLRADIRDKSRNTGLLNVMYRGAQVS
jgi:hypothetical protein